MKILLLFFALRLLLPEEALPSEQIQIEESATDLGGYVDLKLDAFEILDTRCNVCHRKQNPFMVFSLKNMNRRASKIYKQVFVLQRMPKGNEVKLTNEEYNILKKWLLTQNTF